MYMHHLIFLCLTSSSKATHKPLDVRQQQCDARLKTAARFCTPFNSKSLSTIETFFSAFQSLPKSNTIVKRCVRYKSERMHLLQRNEILGQL